MWIQRLLLYIFISYIKLSFSIDILYLYMLVQKSACAGEAGVEEVAVAVGTCKGSLNRRWGCSGKTFDAQVSSLPQQEWSARTENLAEFLDKR